MPTKQKSGLYRTKVKIGVDKNGNDVVKWISGKTKRELEEARTRIIEYYIDGADRPDDRLFGDYAVEWYQLRKKPFVSPSQQNAYRTMLNKHILPEFGDRNLRAIRAADLQRFLNTFAHASASQITMVLSVLHGVFGAAFADRILDADPTVRLQKPVHTPPKERRALTADECRRIEATITTQPQSEYLAVLYYTGMRPGEARGLQWGDIDWDQNMIHIQRDLDFTTNQLGDLKTKAAERYVPLVPPLRDLLLPLRDFPTAPIVCTERGKHISSTSATRLWIRLMQASGLAEKLEEGSTGYPRNDLRAQYRALITPHVLRHNFITMCWDQGMDVQLVAKIVGHADIKVTMAIYTHLNKTHIADAAAQVAAMFSHDKKVAQKLHKAEHATFSV